MQNLSWLFFVGSLHVLINWSSYQINIYFSVWVLMPQILLSPATLRQIFTNFALPKKLSLGIQLNDHCWLHILHRCSPLIVRARFLIVTSTTVISDHAWVRVGSQPSHLSQPTPQRILVPSGPVGEQPRPVYDRTRVASQPYGDATRPLKHWRSELWVLNPGCISTIMPHSSYNLGLIIVNDGLNGRKCLF